MCDSSTTTMKTWDEVYKAREVTEKKVVSALYDCESFRDFLIKVDNTGCGTLIRELFGSDEKYIDSPGDFHMDEEGYEYDIIYHYVCHAEERRLFDLWAYWYDNIKKCYDWTYNTSQPIKNEEDK